jgi:hypothetical protein
MGIKTAWHAKGRQAQHGTAQSDMDIHRRSHRHGLMHWTPETGSCFGETMGTRADLRLVPT